MIPDFFLLHLLEFNADNMHVDKMSIKREEKNENMICYMQLQMHLVIYNKFYKKYIKIRQIVVHFSYNII